MRARWGDATNFGLIAQEVKPIIPEIVGEDKDGLLCLQYERLVPILVNALKEEKAKREALEARVTEIEAILKRNNLA
jgi:hypothetical protein